VFDHSQIRSCFPSLNQRINNRPLVYLDNAATTQKPSAVLDALSAHYRDKSANVHRGNHHLATLATHDFEQARNTVAHFINAHRSEEIIWTRGTTEAINLVCHTWGEEHIQTGDEILISALEHHANIVPWQQLCQRKGASLKIIPLNDDLSLDLATFETLLTPKTKLLSVTALSNALGVTTPIKELCQKAKDHGCCVLIDAAQAVSHQTIDVQDLECDFLVFSGHKMYGPTGIGVLYGRHELLEQMPPWQCGGEMVKHVSFDHTEFQAPPLKFEAGTPAIAEAIGLSAAIDFIQQWDHTQLAKHEMALIAYAREQLKTIPAIQLIIPPLNNHAASISFTVKKHHAHDVSQWLDQHGIAIRTGHHCAMPLMNYLGVAGTLRLSIAMYNTQSDIDALVYSLKAFLNDNCYY